MEDSDFAETIDETIGGYSDLAAWYVNNAGEKESNLALALSAIWLRTNNELEKMSHPDLPDEEWQSSVPRVHYGFAMISMILADMNEDIRKYRTDSLLDAGGTFDDAIGDSDGHP